MAAYPDAKFILTYRETDAWLRSVHNTFIPMAGAVRRFPMWHMSFVDDFTREYTRLTSYLRRDLCGTEAGDLAWRDNELVDGYLKQ